MARAEGITAAGEIKTVSTALEPQSPPLHCLSYRKFDFSSLGFMFGGTKGRNLVQGMVVLYGMVALWGYASVFSSSTASLFFAYAYNESCNVFDNPSAGCEGAYFISMLIFSCIVLTLVLMDLGEQATIQNALTVYRMIAFLIMLVTLVIKVTSEWSNVVQRIGIIGLGNVAKTGKGFGPTILAITCQFNLPDILQPLHSKKDAKFVAFTALSISSVIYLALGILGSIAFDKVNPLTTLNWNTYTACGNGWDACESKTQFSAIFGKIIRFLVLAFPVVNVASSYPIVGISTGQNILLSVPTAFKAKFGPIFVRNTCRLLVSIPPLLLAAGFKRLDDIFSLCGLLGIVVGFSVPGWFQWKSSEYCRQKWARLGKDAWETPYSSALSSRRYVFAFLATSLILFVVDLFTLFWDKIYPES